MVFVLAVVRRPSPSLVFGPPYFDWERVHIAETVLTKEGNAWVLLVVARIPLILEFRPQKLRQVLNASPHRKQEGRRMTSVEQHTKVTKRGIRFEEIQRLKQVASEQK